MNTHHELLPRPTTIWRDPMHANDLGAYLRRTPRNSPNASMSSIAGRTATGPLNSTPRSFWRESLTLLQGKLDYARRSVKAGEQIYQCGAPFHTLYLISCGLFEIVNLAPDGREQAVGLYFKGDWLGFDGIPTGMFTCTSVAMDSGELWAVRYEDLLKASATEPMLMHMVLCAVSSQLARHRETSLSMGTLSADARVGSFLLQWAHSLQERSLRNDEFDLHMSRADMGKHLGLRLESVSRALSKLARCGVIRFNEKGRRNISIPSLQALGEFIQHSVDHDLGKPQPVQ